MNSVAEKTDQQIGSIEFVTFYLEDLLLGIEVGDTREINRHCEATRVPASPDWVHGVINLRGDVITVLDPRVLLAMEPAEMKTTNRNIIVNWNGEDVGLLVDAVGEVVQCQRGMLEPPPANLDSIQRQFISSVYRMDEQMLVVLDLGALLEASTS